MFIRMTYGASSFKGEVIRAPLQRVRIASEQPKRIQSGASALRLYVAAFVTAYSDLCTPSGVLDSNYRPLTSSVSSPSTTGPLSWQQ